MDRILLEITGSQQIDSEKDKIELTTVGTLRDDGSAYIIRYTEEQAPPIGPVKVTVRIQKDESAVQLTRTGALESCLTVEKSKRNLCRYGTEIGDVLLGIYGREIEAKINETNGSFFFGYDIDINGSLASRNTVNIVFSKNQEH